MKIEQVFTRVIRKEYDSGFSNPHHAWNAKCGVIAFVKTEGGALGIGEAWCDSGDVDSVRIIIERDLAARIVGESVAPEALWSRMMAREVMSVKGGALYAAVSAVDIAVWDLYARSLDQPLHRLLGGRSDRVRVYGSSGLYAEGYACEALGEDMARAIEAGCFGVKIKVAGAPLEEDVARVRAVRAAIGTAPALMLDAMYVPTVAEARRLAAAVADYDIYFLEAPTNRADVRGWAELRQSAGMPLSGPEMGYTLAAHRHFLEASAVDYLQADVTLCGGVTELRRISALADAFFTPLTLHASGSCVGFAASAQAGAAFSGGASVELHLLHQAGFDRLWAGGWEIRGGALLLPDAPGLGIDLDPDSDLFTRQQP